MAFNIFKNKQQRGAEKRTKSVKKKVTERKKDVDVLQRYKGGKVVKTGESARLRRVLTEVASGAKVRRDKNGRRVK